MFSSSELLHALRAAGVTVSVDGDRLVLRPAAKVPPKLVPALRERKTEIIRTIREQTMPPDLPDLAPIIARAEEIRAAGADAIDAAVEAVSELAPDLVAGGPRMRVEQATIDRMAKRPPGGARPVVEDGPADEDAVAKTAGLRAQRGRIALDIAISRGLAVRAGTARQVSYEVTQKGVCVCRPPHTPWDGGTASLGVPEDPVPTVRDGDGTAWDGGTAKEESSDGAALPRHLKNWPVAQRFAVSLLEREGMELEGAERAVRAAWSRGARGDAPALAEAARQERGTPR